MDPSPPTPSAEALFAEYIERVEAGEQIDFAAYCGRWPARAAALQRVHVRWQAMAKAFTELSHDAGPASAPSQSVDDLKARLHSPGGRLARYALGQEIARGAMGRIVRAWDAELRREVALKIHRGEVGDTRLQRRFLEEAQIAAQLDHPGIVPIHELGVDGDGRPFFAMQLVRGRDLGRILVAVRDGQDGWSRTRVLGVLLRVCEAMAFAHDRGVVHRDLKPANIMVGRFGETYVMDWGLAHVIGGADGREQAPERIDTLRQGIAQETAASALLTRAGDVVGTPSYMAPEQAAGGNHASPAVDVYSLGAILYHLLTGDSPYAATAGNADLVLRALRAGPPPPLPDDVPPELRAICERAMARDRSTRYAGMAELADDLRAFLEVRTVRAYATGRFADLRKWVARNRTLSIVLLAFAVALVGGAIALAALWVRAEENRRRADAGAASLLTQLDRSAFQGARQALQLDNTTQAAGALWRAHFLGRMPRSTAWALKELAERDPYVVAVPEHGGQPVAFTARGDGVLVAGTDGRLQLRDPGTLALLAEIGEPGPRATALAPLDDTRVVAGTVSGEVALYDLSGRRLAHRTRAHDGAVSCIGVAGSSFVSTGADGKALLWTDPRREPRAVLTQAQGITALAIRPAGDGIVVGDDQGAISGVAFDGSWRMQRWRRSESIAALAFADTPDRLWLSDNQHQLQLLDLAGRTRQLVRPTRNGLCPQFAHARDGSLIVGGWWRTDRLAADGSASGPFALRPVNRMAISPDRRWLVTSSRAGGLGVVDLDPTDRRTIPGAGACALAGNGRIVATSAGDHATIHDVATGAVVREMPPRSNGWLALDREGRYLASSRLQEGTIRVHETGTGRLVHASVGPTSGSGFSTRFAPDGSELAFAVGADRLRRVRTADWATIAEYALPDARIVALSFSADSRRLAVAAHGRSAARVFDLASGSHRDEEFGDAWPANVGANLSAIALSPDGRTLAVGNASGPICVRTPDGATMVLPGHAGTVWSLQFAGVDPGLLFSCGGAQGLAAWDLDSGDRCYQAEKDQVSQLEVSEDGATLSCITPAGALRIDLAYRDRHVAGNLALHLDTLRSSGGLGEARERELRTWAAEVMARPWPRWR